MQPFSRSFWLDEALADDDLLAAIRVAREVAITERVANPCNPVPCDPGNVLSRKYGRETCRPYCVNEKRQGQLPALLCR